MASNEKTEKATPKKKQDERKKGNIFQSQDITSALSLMGIFVVLKIVGPLMFSLMKSMFQDSLTSFGKTTELTKATALDLLGNVMVKVLILALPIGLASIVIAFIMSGAQTRFIFNMQQVKPKFSRINPLRGIKNMFSVRSVVELIKSIFKIAVIGIILYTDISANIPTIMKMLDADLLTSFAWVCDTIFGIVIKIGALLLAFGAADYFYQWWQYEREMRMTKQEVKDEFKQIEGDPQVKGHIRDMQRRMAAARMMQKVPLADVVIKNPTHYAVALKYEPKKDKAPRVLAKGADYVALKIIETAEKHGITVTENRPLARGLYEAVEIDQQIPEQFYQAVADVLAFVYSLKRRKRGI